MRARSSILEGFFHFPQKKSLTDGGRASVAYCEGTFYSGSFCGVHKRELNVLFGSFQPGAPLSCLSSELAGEKKTKKKAFMSKELPLGLKKERQLSPLNSVLNLSTKHR